MFSSLKGIQDVRIQPIIQTMMIQYKSDEISRNHLLRCVSLFFHQQPFYPLNNFMGHVKPNVRGGRTSFSYSRWFTTACLHSKMHHLNNQLHWYIAPSLRLGMRFYHMELKINFAILISLQGS